MGFARSAVVVGDLPLILTLQKPPGRFKPQGQSMERNGILPTRLNLGPVVQSTDDPRRGGPTLNAKAGLVLILAREHRPVEVMSLICGLYDSYPHNFLFAMAAADLLKTFGQLQEAVDAYQKFRSSWRGGLFLGERMALAAFKLGQGRNHEIGGPEEQHCSFLDRLNNSQRC